MGVAAILAACGDDETSGSGSGGSGVGGEGTGGGGGAGGGGGSVDPGPEPPSPWVPAGNEDGAAFAAGVQVGDATSSGAIASVWTSEGTVSLHVAVGTIDGWEEVAVLDGLAPDAGTAQVEITDLLPDHTYSVVFYAADGQRRSATARFRTALAEGNSRLIRFGATSCLGGNEPWPNLSHAAGEKLDFFMMLGDTIYADVSPNTFDYETKWAHALGVQGLRDLAASTSIIATWDDHEVDNNWSWTSAGIENRVSDGLTMFKRGWPIRPGGGEMGIWRKLSWGAAVDVFVLECRGERRDGNYISAEQLAWIKQALSESTARFKFIMNSVPIVDFSGTPVGSIEANDRWQGFPAQRSDLVGHIDAQGITGVLWLTGDFHIGGLGAISAAGEPGATQTEVLCGPSGSPINPAAPLINPDDRFPVVIKTHNYTLFEADPDAGTVRVVFIGDDGGTLGETTLSL